MLYCNEKEIENFISDYTDEIEFGNAAIFAGAGLSVGAGAVSWKELLREAAKKIQIDVDKEYDLVSVAQYIYNQSNSRNQITRLIKNHINTEGKVTENHKILSSLPIKNYWTTNYDEYIEESLKLANKKYDSKKSIHDLSIDVHQSDVKVFKMHGDINRAHEAVLIKDDYEIYDKKNELFTLALKNDLISKTFLFIGFSFDDPNLEVILSKVRLMLEGNFRTHYCFFKLVNENDPEFKEEKDEKIKSEKVAYSKNKQYLKIKDLERYGIKSILVENYNQITEILLRIQKKYMAKNIFISGSHSDTTNKEWVIKSSPDDFISELALKLSLAGYRITTGLGLYVGNEVLSGVMSGMEKTQNNDMDSVIKIRPFSRKAHKHQKEKWYEYRENIMKDCGTAIFIMGNKFEKDTIIDANGVKEEFEIAQKQNKTLIPIGSSGYQSKKLWEEINTNIHDYYPHATDEFIKLFNNLNSCCDNPNEIINSVIEIVKYQEQNII